MRIKPARINIRYLVAFGAGAMIICFIVLSLSLVLMTKKLQSMNNRILIDSRALELGHRLVIEIIKEQSRSLSSQVTKKKHKSTINLMEADKLVGEISRISVLPENRNVLNDVENQYEIYKAIKIAENHQSVTGTIYTADNLLKAVENYRNLERKQLDRTIASSDKLDSLIDRWSMILIISMALVLAAGSLAVLNRIMRPTYALMRSTEKIGQGDFFVRVPVYHDDEIGMLCNAFNDMADGICRLENERMNFIAVIAHDLRNPLSVITLAARRIKRKIPASGDEALWLERIIEKSEYIDNLIGNLMETLHLESGSFKLQIEEFELLSLIRDIVKVQSELVKNYRFSIVGDSECVMQGDTHRLKRVFENLLSNAVKYSPENTTVTVSVEKKDADVSIKIKDEGAGIESDEIKDIFQPFTRLPRTEKMAPGTGLGLFSAKLIVEAHDGKLNLFGNCDGSGTTAEIILPLTQSMSHG